MMAFQVLNNIRCSKVNTNNNLGAMRTHYVDVLERNIEQMNEKGS